MVEKKNEIPDSRSYYLKEFQYFDGECDITFNIVDIDFDKKSIHVAVTDRGKISVREYDLRQDDKGELYFTYGCQYDKIQVNDFEIVED